MKKIIAIVALATLGLTSCLNETIPENAAVTVNVKASEITPEFKKDAVASKLKFENQVIAVEGKIRTIQNFGRGTAIQLISNDNDTVGIYCEFNDDQQKSIRELKEGQIINAIGKGTDYLYDNYTITGCRLNNIIN